MRAALADADVQPFDAAAAPASVDLSDFDAVVRVYQPRVTRLAYRLLGWCAAEVDDVVQDVFVAVLRGSHAFRGNASLGTWLTAITVNRCRSEHRRRQLRSLVLLRRRDTAAAEEVPAWGRTVQDETADRVRTAVQALPPRDREAIVLRYFEGLAAAEIAAVTRQSVNAVEVRLLRARARLAGALGALMREEQ